MQIEKERLRLKIMIKVRRRSKQAPAVINVFSFQTSNKLDV